MDASVTAIDIFAAEVSLIIISSTFLPLLFTFATSTDSLALNSCKRLFTNIILSAMGCQSLVNNENCTTPVGNSSIGSAAFCT